MASSWKECTKIGNSRMILQWVQPICFVCIRMSHWHQQMIDGAEFWISCKWLKALWKASKWQQIKWSAPTTICWCQCDIRIHIYILQWWQFSNYGSSYIQNFYNSKTNLEMLFKLNASQNISFFTKKIGRFYFQNFYNS